MRKRKLNSIKKASKIMFSNLHYTFMTIPSTKHVRHCITLRAGIKFQDLFYVEKLFYKTLNIK